MAWDIAWRKSMQYRNSLRFRIFATFLATGLVLGPLLALGFITLENELEEFSIQRTLAARLNHVMATSEEASGAATPDSPRWRIFGNIDVADLPAELHGKTGLYMLEAGKPPERETGLPPDSVAEAQDNSRSWFLAVGQRAGVTYVVASDQTMLEHRESLTGWVITAGTFLSVCASLWFGYTITSRLIQPLQQLAAATTGNSDDSITINPDDYPPDEIGQLAHALKRKHDGLSESLVREKAFSAEVAHELRNPLAVIQSTMEIIEGDSNLRAPSARALNRALEASREMSETLATLLLLGREHSDSARYPAVAVAALLLPLIEKYSGQSTTQLHWEQRGQPTLCAPPEAIRMVADNLLRNALQNTPTGRVDVSLLDHQLIIRDTGIGIPAAELAAVRENGIRGSNALVSGSGLGLSLVERLCSRFGWQLEIQSTLGKGTTVQWWFDNPIH